MTSRDRMVITSLGHYHPEHRIPNSFFDKLDIGSDGNWVGERTGIQSRHSVLCEDDILALRRREKSLDGLRAEGRLLSVADMARPAWSMMLERDPQAGEGVYALTCGTSVPDYDIPANACTIASAIDLNCLSFDVNSACSSFVVNLHAARHLLHNPEANKIVTFIPERYSTKLNYEDRASCVLFGDGCAGAVIEKNSQLPGLEILDTYVTSNPSKYELVQIPVGGQFYQNGSSVQKFAITRTIEATKTILERNDVRLSDVSYFIGHQANLRMLSAAAQKLGFSESQHLCNVEQFGNQGGAGAPSVMSMHWDRFQSGDLIVAAVVGSGLTWGSVLLRRT